MEAAGPRRSSSHSGAPRGRPGGRGKQGAGAGAGAGVYYMSVCVCVVCVNGRNEAVIGSETLPG